MNRNRRPGRIARHYIRQAANIVPTVGDAVRHPSSGQVAVVLGRHSRTQVLVSLESGKTIVWYISGLAIV